MAGYLYLGARASASWEPQWNEALVIRLGTYITRTRYLALVNHLNFDRLPFHSIPSRYASTTAVMEPPPQIGQVFSRNRIETSQIGDITTNENGIHSNLNISFHQSRQKQTIKIITTSILLSGLVAIFVALAISVGVLHGYLGAHMHKTSSP